MWNVTLVNEYDQEWPFPYSFMTEEEAIQVAEEECNGAFAPPRMHYVITDECGPPFAPWYFRYYNGSY